MNSGIVPVFLKTEDFSEPAAALYALVAANGNFLVKKTPLFTSIASTRDIAGLIDQQEHIFLHFPKVPRDVLEQIYGFFQSVYDRWEGEAIAFLYYHPRTGKFRVDVPPQAIFRHRTNGRWRTEGRLEYGYLGRPTGFLKLGDAHSHADMPAFFSHTDDEDDQQDGLRIVLGDLDRSRPHVKVSFVSGRVRFVLKPEEVLEEFSVPLPPQPEWLRRVTLKERGGDRDRDQEERSNGQSDLAVRAEHDR